MGNRSGIGICQTTAVLTTDLLPDCKIFYNAACADAAKYTAVYCAAVYIGRYIIPIPVKCTHIRGVCCSNRRQVILKINSGNIVCQLSADFILPAVDCIPECLQVCHTGNQIRVIGSSAAFQSYGILPICKCHGRKHRQTHSQYEKNTQYFSFH